jgi:hypothetical protein
MSLNRTLTQGHNSNYKRMNGVNMRTTMQIKKLPLS